MTEIELAETAAVQRSLRQPPRQPRRPFTIEEARELGRNSGWIHAAFVDAYGAEPGRDVEEVKRALMPGGLDWEPCVWAFSDGFDSGAEEFGFEQQESW